MSRPDVPAPRSPVPTASVLAQALRGVRRLRGLSTAEVARAMNLPRRSYEHFEAGTGRLNIDRVLAFAEVTQSDGYAILAAVLLGAPDLARRCADNKLAAILLMALQDFQAQAGDEVARLSPQALISAFEDMFAGLAAEAGGCEADAQAWLAARRPKPRS